MKSYRLVVGAPVRERQWVIEKWFEHLATAVEHEMCTAQVAIVLVGPNDDPTRKPAEDLAAKYSFDFYWVDTLEEVDRDTKRRWWARDYYPMAAIRNQLLAKVRELEPDMFWSLDTDILVAENCLSSAARLLGEYDAVGMKLYMTPKGRSAPSYAYTPARGGLRRPDHEGIISVDAIMASKLMSPKAYNIDYCYDRMGEDIGWSKTAKSAGLRLGWDGHNTSKHVMKPEMLDVVDQRCGF